MKINFNKHFKTYDGKESPEVMSVVIAQALFAAGGGNTMDAEQKFKAYRLSQTLINSPGEVEITTEEATLIKNVCNRTLTAGGYGQVYDTIENG